MSILLNCRKVTKSFGSGALFREIDLSVEEGDRLGLIGPNGSGKTTLLRILAGLEQADEGTVALRKLTRLAYVPQDSVFPAGVRVRDVLEAAAPANEEKEGRVAAMLGVAGFVEPHAEAARLSGGWRKRLALSEALIQDPDILLLDEPTNHLDLAGILWLEKLLAEARFAVAVVSHDRYFLENVATSMAELSPRYPGGFFRVAGNYSRFLEQREDFFEAQQKLQASLESKVRREVEWLRRGAKARTTKSKARIDEANRLIGELGEVSGRARTAVAGIDFTVSDRRTKRLVEAEGLAFGTLFQNLDLTLMPGMRLGLVGANGSGKTTLLRVLTGALHPTAGTLKRADGLRIVYFDQHREQLNPDAPLRRALAEHGDSVIYRGRPQHVAGWAKRFLFRPEQLESPVGSLSGGERARVLIARLMLQEADLLLLDEPANDLDIPTLEVLEESLLEFPGAMVLVTHDRFLLDRVATVVLGLDGQGGAVLHADYAQWEKEQAGRRARAEKTAPAAPRVKEPPKKRLSYLESREWDSIEGRIAAAEGALEERKAALQAPDVVVDGGKLEAAYQAMIEAQNAVDMLYDRWAELEAKLSGAVK
ncbi:MAG: Energy-dependent translational throttle protein EttA [Bryobacteraceae bacterium]|nr:Energy-dependent translational throttle protein EttA [Bryobacteraceae bacterium]